ncbi:uncharacterized protein LOC62_01G000625 [Vanrija pseudolonga]|uniref:Uncharacterized protein n=1 Tax=Vanrija pseudolonga TaxID=143232 RepID=A0AAF1BID9_9TREE|nr:hypothetical protein LOC62_01G000625 [Vanrija pseudolonga]
MPSSDVLTSAGLLVLLVVVVYAAVLIQRKLTSAEASASKSLQAHGVTYSEGKLSVKTDRAPLSREQQIAAGKDAIAGVAKRVEERGGYSAGGAASVVEGVSSGYESPGKAGFRRTKKLD